MKAELFDDDHHTFHCHKTLDYSGSEPRDTENTAICSGFIHLAYKVGRLPIALRFAWMTGLMTEEHVQYPELVYDSWDDMIEGHT